MGILAIANICNGKNTIGFRLIDSESLQIKDVPVENLKAILISGNVQVGNLKVEYGKVTGSNGDIERLPKLVNGRLVGKSPLIIVAQLGDQGYTVSDYTGNIINMDNSYVIEYAKRNGISNGKVVEKDGVEFISSINGQYTRKEIPPEMMLKRHSESSEKLLPILISDNSNVSKWPRYKLIRLAGSSEILITDVTESPIDMFNENIKSEYGYHTDKYTLAGRISQLLRWDIKQHVIELMELIKTSNFRETIDKRIATMKAVGARTHTRSRISHAPLYANYPVEGSITYDNTHPEIIKSYLEQIRLLGVQIYKTYIFSEKNIVLIRKINKSDKITYKVWDYRNSEIVETGLEIIFNNNRDYSNVEVEGEEISIRCLDETHIYNMEDYSRRIVESSRNTKAAMLGIEYKETLTASGVLLHLSDSRESIKIPEGTIQIEKEAIVIGKTNKNIIFGSGIIACSSSCFVVDTPNSYVTLDSVVIRCNSQAAISIAKSMQRAKSSNDISIKIGKLILDREITPAEFAEFTLVKGVKSIEDSGSVRNNDEFAIKVIKYYVDNRLKYKEFEEKGKEISKRSVTAFKENIQDLNYIWKRTLSEFASTKLRQDMANFIGSMTNKLENAQSQLERNLRKKMFR